MQLTSSSASGNYLPEPTRHAVRDHDVYSSSFHRDPLHVVSSEFNDSIRTPRPRLRVLRRVSDAIARGPRLPRTRAMRERYETRQ